MLDPRVRPRVHQRFVPVVMANQVRRGAVLAAGLDDNRRVFMHPDHFSLEVDPVTYRCSHPSPFSGLYYRVWSRKRLAKSPFDGKRHRRVDDRSDVGERTYRDDRA